MRYRAKHLMNLCCVVIAVGVIITAIEWPFKTAFFPLMVSIFLFFGAMADLLLDVFGVRKQPRNRDLWTFNYRKISTRQWPLAGR
jgi:hypothetical protein